MKYYCSDCGKVLECGNDGECWSDNPNALTHSHLGGVKCRDCYAKIHNFCTNCNDKPLVDGWLYCPWCGQKIN